MTFLGLTAPRSLGVLLAAKLTSLPGRELQDAHPGEDAEKDTDLPLKCHTVSNKFVLQQFVVHLRHCLHHGPAMFPVNVHMIRRDRLYIWTEPEEGYRAAVDDAFLTGLNG